MLKKGVERTLSKVGIQSYKDKKKKPTLLHAGDVHGLKINLRLQSNELI